MPGRTREKSFNENELFPTGHIQHIHTYLTGSGFRLGNLITITLDDVKPKRIFNSV